MTYVSHPIARIPAAFRLVSSLIVALACGTILEHETSASLATGSVTARVYVCPESVSLSAVKQATRSPLLAACQPFEDGTTILQLRSVSGGPPQRSEALAPGVHFWPWLEFGDYDLDGLDADSGFSGLLITTADGVPVGNEGHATIAIPDTGIEIERRIYLFNTESPHVDALVDLTLEGSGG